MKNIIVAIVLAGLFAGCAHVKVERILPDQTVLKAEYWRLFNQKIEGFSLEAPGWHMRFDKQQSDFVLGFNAGVVSVNVGAAP